MGDDLEDAWTSFAGDMVGGQAWSRGPAAGVLAIGDIHFTKARIIRVECGGTFNNRRHQKAETGRLQFNVNLGSYQGPVNERP